MNLRITASTILLSSLLAIQALAADFRLIRSDFSHAEERGGLVFATLSDSGQAKFQVFNEASVGKKLTIDVGGVSREMLMRAPIHEGKLQFGPFSLEAAQKIVSEINGR